MFIKCLLCTCQYSKDFMVIQLYNPHNYHVLDFLCESVEVLVALLCLTLCDPMNFIACQSTLSKELSTQQYWSG